MHETFRKRRQVKGRRQAGDARTDFPELVIEDVRPSVDGGRHAAKRIVGDRVAIRALVFRDGHDLLAARLLVRAPDEGRWRDFRLEYDRFRDEVSGFFVVDRIGAWTYVVEAWTDHFGSWRAGLDKKVAAEQDVGLDLLEGALLLDGAATRAKGADRKTLEDHARRLRDESVPQGQRAALALSAEVVTVAERYPDRARAVRSDELVVWVDREAGAWGAWYEMFPRSCAEEPRRHGTFTDAERLLPEIAGMGFDVVYLPPIHPIGRSFRKGKNNSLAATPEDVGSPWAIGATEGGHDAVHPELGTLDDFRRFVTRAGELGLEVSLDYALQCAPDHPWVKDHPDWFHRRPDGSIRYAENPPKKYQDIYPINFWCEDRAALWEACRDLFLFWIDQGVRIFRVDNPHTKPFSFWEWTIAQVRAQHPDTIFLSEAFTRPAPMYGLAKLGFTQSYTYFTWRNSPGELRDYMVEITTPPVAEFFRPNLFVNTPDILNDYLQHGGPPAFRVRLILAATLSPLYGVYSGYELFENIPLRQGSEEYLHSEKYEIVHRNRNSVGHLRDEIATINRIRRENPAFRSLGNLSFHLSENETILFYRKHAPGNDVLVAVNLDPEHARDTMVHVPIRDLGIGETEPYVVEDLLTGERYTWQGARNYVRLDPTIGQAGHVFSVRR